MTSEVIALPQATAHNQAMTKPQAIQSSGDNRFGALLRSYRQQRRLSQLELSFQAGVSQRHLSYLECGRAQPSRPMVLQLAQALDLALQQRNQWLNAAGFANAYTELPLDADTMTPVREVLKRMLDNHAPFPAVVVDRYWCVVDYNAGMQALFMLLGGLEALEQRCQSRSILHWSLHPEGMRPLIANFEEVAVHLLERSAREAAANPELRTSYDALKALPDLPDTTSGAHAETAELMPVLPTKLQMGPHTISLLSTLTTFGTAQDITAEQLRIEHFFPADHNSEQILKTILGQ
nr:helix-turn-helix transcriptional regulator [Oceanococcus sp. HetDA_MAG_MS8]